MTSEEMRKDFDILRALNLLNIEKEKHLKELHKLETAIGVLQSFTPQRQNDDYEVYSSNTSSKGKYSYEQFMQLTKEARYKEVLQAFHRTCKEGSSSRKEIMLDLFGEFKSNSTPYQTIYIITSQLEHNHKAFYTNGRRLYQTT